MKYKKNFLTKVILRADYLNNLSDYEEFPSALSERFREKFPIVNKNKTQEQTFALPTFQGDALDGNDKINNRIYYEWKFTNSIRTVDLVIAPSFFALEFSKYNDFQETQSLFNYIVDIMSKYYNEHQIQIARFGQRYINEIFISGGNPLMWKNYLNKNLLGAFDFVKSYDVKRVMHFVEFVRNSVFTRFQYGMHNPDYPSSIRQHLFVLDIDTSRSDIFSVGDLTVAIVDMHDVAVGVFENSITDKLRGKLNAV